ncbi:hypothetical protein FPQ18DRAFT_308438 [Pyronema domesticum]|nr:hypothetical protein FPQ18DRAFT_308438 [Pyronema domesticum]
MMAAFFPRPSTLTFRPGQSTSATSEEFGVSKDKAASPDEVPEIQRVNVQTSRTIETHQTAPPVRKGLIDIVSDEPRPEIVLVVHMHGYQPLAVGDRNLQHANPFAFIHEITMRDAIYLTLGVPAETDIDIKRLVDKCRVLIDEADKLEDIYEISDADIYRHEAVELEKKKPLIKLPEIKLPEIDVEQLPRKIPRKWQRYLTMSREKRTLCEELDERWETLLISNSR